MRAISGGKLGDFLHQMMVPKIFYEYFGIKTDLYIADIGDAFHSGIENTYGELKSIVERQEYILSFNIYNPHIHSNIDLNLSSWRVVNTNIGWTDKLFQNYFPNSTIDIKSLKILSHPKVLSEFKDSIVINRSLVDYRMSDGRKYPEILEKFEPNSRYFVFSDDMQWEKFPYKSMVTPLKLATIESYFDVINSCKLFLGNLSMPMAIAYCLGKNIVCEFGLHDRESYLGDIKYCNNITWFS